MICQNCRHAIATRRYAYGLTPVRIAPICEGCRERLDGMGMALRPQSEPVDTRPEWMRRSLSKVMDHGTVA